MIKVVYLTNTKGIPMSLLRSIRKNRDLIRTLVSRGIAEKYKGSILA